jgi:hypothetical protein|tara:strand:+ start:1028 stop:1234 length:207 start_codon:yes stop_codon:yes gene_type:complete
MGTHNSKVEDEETRDMVAEFLANGGEVTKGKTKAMASDLGISNNTWGNKLTKKERVAKEKKITVDSPQ